MSETLAAGFSVDTWGSDPDLGNDDCWTGEEFATIEEAEAAFDKALKEADRDTEFVTLSPFTREQKDLSETQRVIGGKPVILMGDEIKRARNPKFKRRDKAAEDRAWQREIAMEAGMLHGVDAYNDAMGYSLEPNDE